MKKNLTVAVLSLFALFGVAAATWEGSAITGGAGEFPAEGLYAACNSFPRDSVIEVSNLENGKTVTVTIVSNVANPGVFIALSPKAAEALGMKPGSAVRVRAVSLAVSEAEATLPAARAGVSADPDFNPRVFFEREKAALAAAAAAEPSGPSVASVASASAPPAAQEQTAAQGQPPTQPTAPAEPATPSVTTTTQSVQAPPAVASTAPQRAEVLARSSKTPAETAVPVPQLSEPSAQTPAVPAQVTQTSTVAVQPTPIPEKPDTASVETLKRPAGSSEPSTVTALAEPKAPEARPSEAPDPVLGRIPSPPAKPEVPLLSDAEPAVRERTHTEGAETLALARQPTASFSATSEAVPLSEAELPGVPEAVYVDKPAATVAGTSVELAEAEAPQSADAIGDPRPSPSYSSGPVDVALAEPSAPKTPLQTGVVAIGGGRPTTARQSVAEMAEPDVPVPSESLVAVKPAATSSTVAANDEPAVKNPVDTGAAPNAILTERPTPLPPSTAVASLAEPSLSTESSTGAFVAAKPALETPAETALAVPPVPTPTESITSGPSAPASKGAAVVVLEPALPRPPEEAAKETVPILVPTQPVPPPSTVATIKGTGGIAEPPLSLPIIKGLDKGAYYIQIGVYGSNDALMAASSGLRSNYPVAIERISTKSGEAYRLYIGPIARDESGLALLKIRSLGYKDAFVRQGS